VVDFRIDVVVDPSGVVRGTSQVESRLNRLETSADRLRGSIARAFAFVGGAAVLRSAVGTLSSFDQAVANAGAVASASSQQLEQLRQTAQQLGATTRFTATDAAEGLTFLARAGFSVEDSIATVDDALRLAQVGNLSLAESADIATNVLAGFNLSVDESARFVDVLAKGANSSNTSVRQLGEAFSFVAPIAAGVGVDIEEAAAAIGVLSNAGIQGSRAGTGLQRVISRLSNPTKEAQVVLSELGLTAADVNIETEGLTTVLDRLAQAGVSATQALVLAGDRGGPAITALTANVPQIRELNEQLDNAEDFSKRTATALDDTLQGSLRSVASAFEAVIIALGDAGAIDALRVALDALAESLRFVARNIEILLPLIGALSAALGAALVRSTLASGAALLRLPPIFGATAVSATGAATGISAATAATLRFAGAAGVAVGGLLILRNAINRYNDDLKEIGETLNRLEEDGRFISGTAQGLTAAQRELNNLNRTVAAQQERGVAATDSQLARIAQLEERISSLRDRLRGNASAQERANEETEKAAKLTEEQEAALARQRAVLASIRGPQEEYRQFQEDLQALLERNLITQQEFNAALADAPGAPATADPLSDTVTGLGDEIAVLQQRAQFGEQAAEVERIRLDLLRQGRELTDGELESIRQQLAERSALNQRISDDQRARQEAERAAQNAREEAQRREQAVQQNINRLELANIEAKIRQENGESAITDFLIQQARLRAQGITLTEEQTNALREQIELARQNRERQRIDTNDDGTIDRFERLGEEIRQLDQRRDFGAGLSRGFKRLQQEAEDLAAVGERVANVFADTATDAILKFVETGEFNFREFANSILQELLRIIVRLLVVQALNAAFGGGAGGAVNAGVNAGVGAAARQTGGVVQRNRSFVVGERGPELFTPGASGFITPNRELQQQQAPQVTVQPNIINVRDPNEIPEAIANGAADQAIINVLTRNRETIRTITQ
jgi:TP901 family phage tail tape measure protein/lambda family phage tail tape measure protein